MGYVDAFDRNRELAQQERAAQDKELAEKRTELVERDERARGLFMDERRHYINELVRVDLDATKGYVPPEERQAQQDAVWAALEPIIYEDKDRPLSVDAVKALVAAIQRGRVSNERVGQMVDFVRSHRTKVYETLASKDAERAQVNADLAQRRPRLNALCKATGAGDSVALYRELGAEAADRAAGRQRLATRPRTGARPLSELLKR